jgi:hypothetical protein
MNNNTESTDGCSEEFAQLCALSTSGELSAEEFAALDEHVAGCAPCSALLREYTSLAHVAMAKLAADREQETHDPFGYNEACAEERFVTALRAARPSWRARLRSQAHRSSTSSRRRHIKQPTLFIGTAAVLLISIAGTFESGRKRMAIPSHVASPAAVQPLTAPDSGNTRLKAELATAQASLMTISEKSFVLEKRLAELSNAKTSLAAQIDALTQKSGANSASLVSVSQQRDSLQQQLADASNALIRANDELTRAQQDRQGALYRVASLETEVQYLHAELSATNNSAGNDERFLAVDRDIRELMGARQLYIADVFDVRSNGERSKPFGRVFYTKGKSLIFYAFDLQTKPGYREAEAFQAWGKPDNASAKPISLGIFYMDNEQNRRWVVKSDNPDVLAQISKVFVTAEPHGGSQRPTGKPFLEAYLHSLPPNHP